MRKIILIGLVLILLSSFVSADLTTTVSHWRSDGNGLDFVSSNDGIVDADLTTGIINQGYSFGSGKEINYGNDSSLSGDNDLNFSVSTFIYYDGGGGSNGRVIYNKYGGTDVQSGTSLYFSPSHALRGWHNIAGTYYAVIPDETYAINHWYHITMTYSQSAGLHIYVNDTDVSSGHQSTNSYAHTEGGDTFIGSLDGSNTLYSLGSNTIVDEVTYYGRTLNLNEISQIKVYVDNGTQYPYTSSPINDPESAESTTVIKQTGSVSFVGTTTILSGTFNLSTNNTPVYGGYDFNILTNNNNQVYCEIQIDGVSVANITRSNIAGVTGNVFIQTPLFLADNTTEHIQELICERVSGVGLTTITESVGIGHFLVGQDNLTLNYNSLILNNGTSSGSTFNKIDSFDITIGNKIGIDNLNHLILEGAISYTNNDISDEILGIYININGTNCSHNPRFVEAGNSGSTSYDCIIENVTRNSTYKIDIYGNGTNANYEGNIVAKNFFLADEEIAGGTGILKGVNFTGNTNTKLFNLTGGNLHHDNANVFQKVGYSIETDVDTEVTFYVKIVDGSTWITKNFTRQFEANKIGFLIGHDILEEIPQDPNYELELWANCGTIGATCEIKGGASLGYLTDVQTIVLNQFNITAYNNWNDTQIMVFNVTDGATYTTTEGIISFFTRKLTENITISSNNYFNKTYFNHNTSNNLNATLIPYTNVTANYINGTIINDFSIRYFDINTPSIINSLTANGTSLFLPLYNSSYNLTINGSSSYSSRSHIINVSSYLEEYNFTVYPNPSSISIIIRDADSGNKTNETIDIIVTSLNSQETYSTSNGSIFIDGLQEGSYNFKFSGDNYSITNVVVTVGEFTHQNLNVYLSTNTNILTFTALDQETSDIIDGLLFIMSRFVNNTNVNVESEYTDVSGRAQLNYKEDLAYCFVGTKEGYQTRSFCLDPIKFGEYDVKFVSIAILNDSSDYSNVNILYSPKAFYENEQHDILFRFISPIGSFLNYNVNITYPSGSSQASGVNANGEDLLIPITIGNTDWGDKIIIEYSYTTTTDPTLKTFRFVYPINKEAKAGTFISNRNQTFGLGDFERASVGTAGLILFGGAGALFGGALIGGILALMMMVYYVFIGFWSIWAVIISFIVGFVILIWGSSR